VIEVVVIELMRNKHLMEGWSIRKISPQLGVARWSLHKALGSVELPC